MTSATKAASWLLRRHEEIGNISADVAATMTSVMLNRGACFLVEHSCESGVIFALLLCAARPKLAAARREIIARLSAAANKSHRSDLPIRAYSNRRIE
jgi:hypothetical protein